MTATITKLGVLSHQLCYSVQIEWPDAGGVSNTFKTRAAAKKFVAKCEAEDAKRLEDSRNDHAMAHYCDDSHGPMSS